MPVESIVLIACVVGMFTTFAGVFFWVSSTAGTR